MNVGSGIVAAVVGETGIVVATGKKGSEGTRLVPKSRAQLSPRWLSPARQSPLQEISPFPTVWTRWARVYRELMAVVAGVVAVDAGAIGGMEQYAPRVHC